MEKVNDDSPHSIAIHVRYEVHQRKLNGQLSGSPKDRKDIRGILHCENRAEANKLISEILERFKEDLKQCQQKLQME